MSLHFPLQKIRTFRFSLHTSRRSNGHHCGPEIRNEFTLSVAKTFLPDLCFAICTFSQVRFITPSHLTHNLFYFSIVFGINYRKRGSASYIVREVRSVRERERDTERERERERDE